jgi:hypothetical protein
VLGAFLNKQKHQSTAVHHLVVLGAFLNKQKHQSTAVHNPVVLWCFKKKLYKTKAPLGGVRRFEYKKSTKAPQGGARRCTTVLGAFQNNN